LLSNQLTKSGKWDQAIKTAKLISSQKIRSKAQMVCVEELLEQGNKTKAIEVVQSIFDKRIQAKARIKQI
jgi:hypothetical protein